MAPPQVELNKKQPLEDVEGWAQKVGDTKLPVLPPIKTNIPVESGTTVGGKRGCGKRRFKTLAVGFVIGVVAAVIICATAFAIHRRHHRDHDEWDCDAKKGHHRGSHSSEEDDRRDHHRHHNREHFMADGSKLHIARNGTMHKLELYAILDFESHMAVYKNNDRQTCYLDRLRESVEEGREKWRRCKHEKGHREEHPVRFVTPEVDPVVLRYVAGEEIAQLCNGLKTYWVVAVPNDELDINVDEIIYL